MSASSATLATIRDRVEQLLVDLSNAIWTTGLIDESVDQALSAYSEVRPQVVRSALSLTTILSTNGREIDISAVTGLVSVVDVWAPYLAADDKATKRRFEHWLEQEVVNLADGAAVSASDTARIFYAKVHTLNGLNSAGATTFKTGDDSLIVVGAAGYACLSRAVDLLEQVTLGRQTAEELQGLGSVYLAEFWRRLGVGDGS